MALGSTVWMTGPPVQITRDATCCNGRAGGILGTPHRRTPRSGLRYSEGGSSTESPVDIDVRLKGLSRH